MSYLISLENTKMYFNKYKKYTLSEVDGVPFIKPIENLESIISYDAFMVKEDITKRFMEIGTVMESINFKDKAQAFSIKKGIKNFPGSCEFFYEFLNADEKKKLLTLIYNFICDYGHSGYIYFNANSKIIHPLRKQNGAVFPCDTKYSSSVDIPVFLFSVYELYEFIKYPDPDAAIECNISHTMRWDNINDRWILNYDFDNLYELVIFTITTQLTSEEGKGLRQCKNDVCDKWFVPENPKAEYCSSACRNVANVRKSRERKKQQNEGL